MGRHERLEIAAMGLMALATIGCTFEGDIIEALNNDPTPTPTLAPGECRPVTISVTTGDTFTADPAFHLYDIWGEEIPSTSSKTPTEGAYSVTVDNGCLLTAGSVRVTASAGNIVLKDVLPCLSQEDLAPGLVVDLDADSTATSLVIDALGAFRGDSIDNPSIAPYAYMIQTFSGDELAFAYDNVRSAIESASGDAGAFAAMVSAVLAAGDEKSGGALMFPLLADSADLLQEDFLAATTVDYDGDGVADTDPAAFNQAAIALAAEQQQAILSDVPLSLYTDADGDTHPYLVTVFTAHMEDGTCITSQNACAGTWINCDEGDSLYFTGGTHEDSPIQDTAFDAMMGEWTPNVVPMYDDGTHGDIVAGDQIYTIVFRFPKGLRIGYKYTYGAYGQDWTSTEEWPGNQRILEIVDNNGDGIVWRDDYVTNETTNKDKNNCNAVYGGCSGTITWDTDLNGDGIPEAQEHPLSIESVDEANNLVKLAGQCTYDQWVRHPLVTRATDGACGGTE